MQTITAAVATFNLKSGFYKWAGLNGAAVCELAKQKVISGTNFCPSQTFATFGTAQYLSDGQNLMQSQKTDQFYTNTHHRSKVTLRTNAPPPLLQKKREKRNVFRQDSPCRACASLHQLLNRSCCESLWRDVRAAKNVCSPFVCEHLKVKSSPAKGFDLLFHFSFLLFRIFQSCQWWKVLWGTGCHANLNVHLDPRRRVGGSLIVIMMTIKIFIISKITWGVGQPAKRVAGLRHSVRSKISRNGREERSPWPHTLPWREREGDKDDQWEQNQVNNANSASIFMINLLIIQGCQS